MQEGDVIDGRYRVESKLGQGGMGLVFRGHDKDLNKPVAIKVLFPNTPDLVIKRFHAEAKALAQLNHPNILTVQHFGQAKDGQLYLVADFIKGESLQSVIEKRGAQTFFDVLPIFEKICRGLRFAHINNVLHRDIKPSNVMLASDRSKEDSVKLVDFGLAKQADKEFHLTQTGSAMGSPPYMSPESVHGKESDNRSDIYSLGCTFFEMMVGRPPFVGDTAFHTMMAQVNRFPPSLAEASGKHFEEEVEEFIQKCLRKNPDDRFQNMDELIAELERVKNSLLEKKELSLEALASGVYASGAFLSDKIRKADQMFKGTTRVAVISLIIVAVATVMILNSKKYGESRIPDEGIKDLAAEMVDPDAEKRILKVSRDGQDSGALIIKDQFGPENMCNLSGKLTDEQLREAVKPYTSMRSFQFEDLEISDKSMKYLLGLPIERLALIGFKISDSLGKDIANMSKLKFLRTHGCGSIPVGFLERFKSHNLDSIDIEPGKNYPHPGVVLAELKSLRMISLGNSNLDRTDIKAMAKALKLETLLIGDSKLSEDAFVDLHMAKQCKFLACAQLKLTAQQVEQIAELPALEILDLHRTNVDDKSLMKLHKCKNLRRIILAETFVSPTGVAVLRAAVPTLEKVEVENVPLMELY